VDQPRQTDRTAKFWDGAHLDDWHADSLLAHPLIQGYMSLRAFGANASHLDLAIREIARRSRPGARILSVGCGAAVKERAICAALPDREIVGIDIAAEALARTRIEAERDGLHNLELRRGDFNDLDLKPDSFDIILGLGAIHHIEQLEAFWRQCRLALRPGGAILAQEYVGPNRFQWTDAQVEHGNRALRTLVPSAHQVHHRSIASVPLETIIEIDPSEAVRAADIIPTCRAAGLEIETYQGCGCGLLQPVLINQAHTFDPRNWDHNHVLFSLFAEEDRLIRAGELGDTYCMFIAV